MPISCHFPKEDDYVNLDIDIYIVKISFIYIGESLGKCFTISFIYFVKV